MKCIRIPFLDVDVYFGVDLEDAKAFIRERAEGEEGNIDGCRGCCYTVTDSQGHNHRMMLVFEGDVGTVAHEATHMARITLKHCGVKWSASNDEPMALLVEWLVKEFVQQFHSEP